MHDSRVRGTFGNGCCDAAGERQLGRLWDGNEIVGGKEPLCLRKAKPSEIGPPKNGREIFPEALRLRLALGIPRAADRRLAAIHQHRNDRVAFPPGERCSLQRVPAAI